MTRFTVSIFAFLFSRAAWAQSGVVSGLVTDERTGLPLPAIEVRLKPVGGTGRQQAVNTDQAGRYLFSDIPVGSWSVTAVRPKQMLATRVGRTVSRCIVLVETAHPADCQLAVARAGVIAGKVADEAGEPLSKVTVSAISLLASERESPIVTASAVTDVEGQYRLTGIPPGRYLVQATAPPPSVRSGYPPTWFPGVATSGEAIRLQVRSGDEIGGIRFSLKSQQRFPLRIDVSALLKAVGPGSGGTVTVANRTVGADSKGIAKIDGLFTGRYAIYAEAGPGGGTRTISAVAEIEVGAEAPDPIKLTPEPRFDLVGHISGNGDSVATAATDSSTMIAFFPIRTASVTTIPIAKVQQAGFRLHGMLASSYRISVDGLRPGYYVSGITVGNAPVASDGVVTLHGGDTISIRVSDEGATLSARTISPDGKAFPGGYTILVDPDSLESEKSIISSGKESSDSGLAAFPYLKPGRYVAMALDSFDLALLRDPETLRKYIPSGVKIDLAPKESKSLNLPLIHFED